MTCKSSRYLSTLQENTLYVGKTRNIRSTCSPSTLCSEIGSQANPCQTIDEVLNVIQKRYPDATSSSLAVVFQNGNYYAPGIAALPSCIGYMGCSNGIAELPDFDPGSIQRLRLDNIAMGKIVSKHSDTTKKWSFDKCHIDQIDILDASLTLDIQQSQIGNVRLHLSGHNKVNLQFSNSTIHEDNMHSSLNFLDILMKDQSSLDIVIQNSTLDIKNKNQIFAELFGYAQFRYVKTNVYRIERKSTYLLHDYSIMTKDTSLNTTIHYYDENVFEYKMYDSSIFNSTKTTVHYTNLDNTPPEGIQMDENNNLQDFQHFDQSKRSIIATSYSMENFTTRTWFSSIKKHHSTFRGNFTNITITTRKQLSTHEMSDQSSSQTKYNNCNFECTEPETLSQPFRRTTMRDQCRKNSNFFNVMFSSGDKNSSVPFISHDQRDSSSSTASLVNYSIDSNFSKINEIILHDQARLDMLKEATKYTSTNPHSQNSYLSHHQSQFKITENNGSQIKTFFHTESDQGVINVSNSQLKALSIKGKFFVNLFGSRIETSDDDIPLMLEGIQKATLSSVRSSALNNHGMYLKNNQDVSLLNSIISHSVESNESTPLIVSENNPLVSIESSSMTSKKNPLIHIIGSTSTCTLAHVAMSSGAPNVVTGEGVLLANPISTSPIFSNKVAKTVQLIPNTTYVE